MIKIIILIFVFNNILFGQPLPDSNEKKIGKLEIRQGIIEERITKIEDLKKSLEHADLVIQRHSTIFTAIGTFATFLGIFIGIVGILSAIATYLFGILPAKEIIKDFELKLDEFLKKEKSKSIDELISDLQSENSKKKNIAATKLSINLDYSFTRHNLKDLIEILKIEKSSYISSILENIIVINPNKITEDYYIEQLKENKIRNGFYNIFRFFILSDTWDKNYQYISKYICDSENVYNTYYNALSTILLLDPDKILLFLNDKECIIKIPSSNLTSLINYLEKNIKIKENLVNNSFLSESAKLIKESPSQTVNPEVERLRKEHEERIQKIINEHGLKIVNKNQVVNKSGEILEIQQTAYTALGPAKIHNTIEIEGLSISLEKLPKD